MSSIRVQFNYGLLVRVCARTHDIEGGKENGSRKRPVGKRP